MKDHGFKSRAAALKCRIKGKTHTEAHSDLHSVCVRFDGIVCALGQPAFKQTFPKSPEFRNGAVTLLSANLTLKQARELITQLQESVESLDVYYESIAELMTGED